MRRTPKGIGDPNPLLVADSRSQAGRMRRTPRGSGDSGLLIGVGPRRLGRECAERRKAWVTGEGDSGLRSDHRARMRRTPKGIGDLTWPFHGFSMENEGANAPNAERHW